MKKLFSFISLTILVANSLFGQLGNSSECIQCSVPPEDTIRGEFSSIIGKENAAEGYSAIAGGANSSASGDFSIAFGTNVISSATNAVSFGSGISNQNTAGLALGKFLQNTGDHSATIGLGYGMEDRLVNSIEKSIMFGMYSTVPTLMITKSPSTPIIKNLTGRVGIGNVPDPLEKLHIKSDYNESSAIFLEPTNWTTELNAELFLGNLYHGLSAELNKGLVFKTENYYLFNQGNMGIGTEEPAAKVHIKSGDIYIEDIDRGIIMKSPDGTCWRGTLSDQGQLIFQSLSECPEDAAITIKESTPNKLDISIHPNPAKNIIEIEIPDLGSNSLVFRLVDENGKVIKSLNITGIRTSVNLADLVPGLYFGTFSGDNIYFVEKIVKF